MIFEIFGNVDKGVKRGLKQSLFRGSKVHKNQQVEMVGRNLLTKWKLNLFN